MHATTKFAVLGLVARQPTYRYALWRQIEAWTPSISQSAVYQVVDRQAGKGLIQVVGRAPAKQGTDEPGPTLYALTDSGAAAVREWKASPPESYEDLRLRIAVSDRADLPRLLEQTRVAERLVLGEVDAHQAPSLASLMRQMDPWEAFCAFTLATLERSELDGRARSLQSVRVALERLADLSDAPRS